MTKKQKTADRESTWVVVNDNDIIISDPTFHDEENKENEDAEYSMEQLIDRLDKWEAITQEINDLRRELILAHCPDIRQSETIN